MNNFKKDFTIIVNDREESASQSPIVGRCNVYVMV